MAARSGPGERLAASREFLAFFDAHTRAHFREEEEVVFPVLLEHSDGAPELLTKTLLEHVEIHRLVAHLRAVVEREAVEEVDMDAVSRALEAHIRLEEKQLFPLIEQIVPDDALGEMTLADQDRTP